jgi:transcription initiation factor TFIIH subunit 3
VVLLETNPALWEAPLPPGGIDAAGARGLGFRAVVEQLLVFVNAFLLFNGGNRLALFALHSDGCHLVYESPELAALPAPGDADSDGDAMAEDAPPPAPPPAPAAAIAAALKALAARGAGAASASPLSGALSRALCYVQRATRGPSPLQPRLLCLHGSADAPAQYVAVMNAIFCAQSASVAVDACLLGDAESPFLQQAASLTGGVYLRPPRPAALLQYLLAVFASDGASRAALRLPAPRGVDFRASCFCHKRQVDTGYVCSVCLSIFCGLVDECSTCGTPFDAAKRGG